MLALVLISLFPASGLLPTAAEGGSRSRAEGVEWVVIGRPVGPAVRGSKAQLEVEVTTRAGFHLNDDYPLNFRSKASSSAAFARPRIDRNDGIIFERCRADTAHSCIARIPVTFTPKVLGAVEVGGTVAFSACNPDRCIIKKVDLTVPVQISEQ